MIKKTYSFSSNGVIDVYTLSNKNGLEADILTYGATLIRFTAPDRRGKMKDCIVGCKRPEDYPALRSLPSNPYFGGTIGRFANRIGGAKFTLNGKEYTIEPNEKSNTLHGGVTASFDAVIWKAEIVGERLVLTHVSPDGAGGFPAKMEVQVTYSLSDENELKIEYFARADKDTVCNLTNHSYFNIGETETVLEHELMINSKKITPVDEELIPHGEYLDVEGTAYSFLPAKPIGKDIRSNEKLIAQCGGYDFNYCLDRVGRGLEHCAYVYDKASGRRLDCYTTQPALQLYTACGLDYPNGKRPYGRYNALCLETQGYPNAPNCPEYPSALLKAGETYQEITVYKFSVK